MAVLKGKGCEGCPFQSSGAYMVPDEVVEGALVEIAGQNPGPQEEAQGIPYVGQTGSEMNRVYLPLAGLTRGEVTISNAVRCRVNGSNTLPEVSTKVARLAMEHCRRAYHAYPTARLTITQGDYALWSHTGQSSSSAWRGYVLAHRGDREQGAEQVAIWTPGPESKVVLATVHLARLNHEPELVLTTRRDWGKAQRIVAGRWPRPLETLTELSYRQVVQWPQMFSFDTEYVKETGKLIRYSFSYKKDQDTLTHVVEMEGYLGRMAQHRGRVAQPGERAHVIAQNAPVDYGHLWRLTGAEPKEWADVDDTSYIHAVLYSDLPHSLDYLGSLYAPTNRWKHLADVAPVEYSGADAFNTLAIYPHLVDELKRDPISERVYLNERRPLVPIIYHAQTMGLRVWQPRVGEVQRELEGAMNQAELKGQVAVGWPINLGSTQQVGHEIYQIGHVKPKRRKRR